VKRNSLKKLFRAPASLKGALRDAQNPAKNAQLALKIRHFGNGSNSAFLRLKAPPYFMLSF